MRGIKFLLFTMILSMNQLFAADIYVTSTGAGNKSGSDWANAKSDLGAVLYNATAGTTVHVGAGTYFPSCDYQGNTSASNLEKRFKFLGGVNVLGGYPATGGSESQRDPSKNATILDGAINNTDTVYTIAYGMMGTADIVVDGINFSHATGRVTGPDNDYMGDFSGGAGAIIIMGGTTPNASSPAGTGMQLINCNFDGFAAKWGGAIKLQKPDQANNPKLTITNCTFTNNKSGQNGGGILAYSWDMDVKNSTFDNNDGGGSGGGIACFNSCMFTADNTLFKKGKVRSNGAGVLFWCEDSDAPSTAWFTDCDFVENDGWDGVGIYSNKCLTSSVSGCTFDGNVGGGAGVIRFNGTFTIDNCIFNNNSLNVCPGGWLDGSSATISNCVYTNNRSSAGQNGVIFKVQIDQVDISNCYATGNSGKSIAGIAWGAKGTMKNVSIVNNTGTAVAFQGATYTIQNMTISGNTSPTNGAVIDGSWEGASSINVYDCTIANNTSADGQNAMYISGGTATIDFENCIYVQNGDQDVDYSLVFGSFSRAYCIWNDMLYGDGRFTPINPFNIGTYLAPIAKVQDQYVHLLIGTDNPAIGTGSPYSAGTLDQLGNKRPENPSIGAVEASPVTDIRNVKINQLTIYPTITTGQLVVVNPFSGKTTLALYSMDGRLMKQLTLKAGDNLINFSDLNAGTHVIILKNGNKIASSRFIKR